MKKRLFSWLLVLAMVLSMMPTVAFAAETPEAGDSNILFEEHFDTNGAYTIGEDASAGTNFIKHKNTKEIGEYTTNVENGVLHIQLTNNSTSDYPRLRIQSKDSFAADKYTVSMKIKTDRGPWITSLILGNVNVASTNNQAFEIRRACGAVDAAPAADAKIDVYNYFYTLDATNALYNSPATSYDKDGKTIARFYAGGTFKNANGWNRSGLPLFANDSASATEFYTYKVAVDKTAKTATASIYDANGDRLGYRIMDCDSVGNGNVQLDIYGRKLADYEGNVWVDDVVVTEGLDPVVMFHEDFDTGYTNDAAYDPAASGAPFVAYNATMFASPEGSATGAKTTTIDEHKVLAVTLQDAAATGTNRAWLKTNKSFYGDYVIETRFRGNGAATMTYFRLSGIKVDNKEYQFRMYPNGKYYGYADLTKDYEGVVANNVDESVWYTLKLYVSQSTNTVITTLYDDDGNLVGSHTLDSTVGALTFPGGPFTVDIASTAGSTRTTYLDYVTVTSYSCPHLTTTTVAEKPATCGEDGLSAYDRCAKCGMVMTSATVLEATGEHDYVKSIKTPATETTEGLREITCKNCDYYATETIPVETCHHTDMTHYEEVAATCVKDGNIEYWVCTCGNVYSDEDAKTQITMDDTVIPASEEYHDMQPVGAKAPNAEEAGYTDHEACANEGCDKTDGKKATWLITAGDENVTLSTSGVVEEGTMVAASPVQAGYAIKALKVNGEAVNGSAFVVDKAATVTAELVEWKFTENFDGEAGSGLPATMAGNGHTEGTVGVVNKGEMTLVTTTASDNDRIGMVTAEKYSGSYVIETRINSDTVSKGYTMLYLNGVTFPRYNNSKYSSIRYDMRLRESVMQPWIELNMPLAAGENTGNASLVSEMGNKITGGVDGSGSRMYFYAHGNPNNKVTDAAAVTYTNGAWYTVKFYVDSVNKSVTTELWNSDGTTLLGSRTLYDAIINSGNFEIQSQLGGTTTVDYIKYACLHANVENVDAVAEDCGNDGHTSGTRCKDCGATLSGIETIPATGEHDMQLVDAKDPSVGNIGWNEHTACSVCGLKDGSYEEIPAYVIDTEGYSLKLEEDVYIYVATKIANFGDEVNGGMLVWNEEPAAVTDEADYVSELTLSGDVYIQNTKGIPAKAYADKVYFCTYVEKDGTKYYGKLNSYSVQDYCKTQLADEKAPAALKTVCSEMLHYGAAAQTYWGEMENLANVIEGILEAGAWNDEYLTAPTPAGAPVGFPAGGAAGTWYAALDLSSLVTMNFAFATEATAENVELLVWYADEDLSLANADRYDMTTATVAGANAYTAAIKGTVAKAYGDTVYACVKVGDTYSTILAYSVEAYAAKTIADEMAEADLCKRMVMYGEAAAVYFAPAAE